MLSKLEVIVAKNIGRNIPVFIKRGCTPFAKAHPNYGELTNDWEPVQLKISEEWKEVEKKFDTEGLADRLESDPEGAYPHKFTLHDFLSMRTWLCYAKTIGDESYKKVTKAPIENIRGLDPTPFFELI